MHPKRPAAFSKSEPLEFLAQFSLSEPDFRAIAWIHPKPINCDKMRDMQRILITVGALLVLGGLLWPWLSRLGLGHLPGDIRIETENGVFYFPITTCIVISVVLSLILWFLRR